MVDVRIYGQVEGLQKRVAYLEAAVAALATATGVTLPESETEIDPEVLALLRDGKKVQAVKVAAKRLGISLKEATEYVGRAEGSM